MRDSHSGSGSKLQFRRPEIANQESSREAFRLASLLKLALPRFPSCNSEFVVCEVVWNAVTVSSRYSRISSH